MEKPAFSFLVCPDAKLLRDHIDSMLLQTPPPSAGGFGGMLSGMGSEPHGSNNAGNAGNADSAWEQHIFWGDEALSAKLWEQLNLQGLFAVPKAIIIRNAQNLLVDDWKKLSESLARVAPTTWVFLCLEVAFDRGAAKVPATIQKQACWKFAQKQGFVWENGGLNERSMPAFITAWAQKRGMRVSPAYVQKLSGALPFDAASAAGELEKLALLTPAGEELCTDMSVLTEYSEGMDIFAFIQALQTGGNPQLIWRNVFKEQGENDGSVFAFLAMLLREARIMWQILAGEQVRLPNSVLQNKTRLARQLGFARLVRLWDLALEAEKGIKSGERKPEQAMEMLIAALISFFASAKA